MEEFSARTRAGNLAAMASDPLDVLVIGGGIVGAWTALTAALRGHRTALLEKGDFASGTSGKTSRLIHGGLRYLQQFRIGLVAQAARERDVLLRIAPDLVRPLTFLIPVYRDRGPKGWQLRFGLWLYDAVSRDKALPPRKWLTREEALAIEPGLAREGLLAAATYADAITRDARLVVTVVRRAAEFGALVANYARVTRLVREGGRVVGAHVRDEEMGRDLFVRTRDVVNATGIWVADLQTPEHRLQLRPTKGIHIFVPHERLGHRHALVLPTRDRRIVFVLPWGDLSLIGTTDTDYSGDKNHVAADLGDVEYLLDAVNRGYPNARLAPDDVVSTYAGLRPLIHTGETEESDISRKHEIFPDSDGLISVAGGKLTTARLMAEEVVRRVESRTLARRFRETKASEDLHRWAIYRTAVTRGWPRFWMGDTRSVRISSSMSPPSLEDPTSMALHAARHEMALHLDDVLVRRSGLFSERPDQGLGIAHATAEVMGGELGWDPARRARELARFEDLVASSRRWREGLRDG